MIALENTTLDRKSEINDRIEQALHYLANKQAVNGNGEIKRKSHRPRHGLPVPIKKFRPARKGESRWGQEIDWLVYCADQNLPVKVEMFPVKPQRKQLDELLQNTVPTAVIYMGDTDDVIVRKVATCIKLGLDIIRHKSEYRKFCKRNPGISDQLHVRNETVAKKHVYHPHPRRMRKSLNNPLRRPSTRVFGM